jgi:predicted phage terminase large subunit-like protein
MIMIDELQGVADGRVKRLMIFMPPGSAKSTYASKLFPAWWLARRKRQKIICAANTIRLARKFSGDVQNFIHNNTATLGCGLATRAKNLWFTSNGGEYLAAGVDTKIPGFRADLALLDDLVPNAKGADSAVQRENIWDWFNSDLDTRLTPGAPIILVMTRWHEDDIAGRLLQHQPDEWRVVKLRAIAVPPDEDPDGLPDPLGRAPGEPLWTDDAYGYGAQLLARRKRLEKQGSARVWYSLYQQSPTTPEGAVFKTDFLKSQVLEYEPPAMRCVRAWDLAATDETGASDPDWTCGVKIGQLSDGIWVVCDVVRFRGGPQQVQQGIESTARLDGREVTIGLPQDPGQAGKSQVAWLTGRLAGHKVVSTPETGSKATRAAPFAAQVNVGNVSIVRGTWNAAFIEELRAFPTGRKDDQVDAASRAFATLLEENPIAVGSI